MIQVTGNLKTIDGLTFRNPLININLISSSKFQPVKANLFIGTIETAIEPDDTTSDYFKSIYELCTMNYYTNNTDFLYIQNLVILDLEAMYLDCTFEIVA
jgi:hypothetical protein